MHLALSCREVGDPLLCPPTSLAVAPVPSYAKGRNCALPRKAAGRRHPLPGQNPSPDSDCGPTPWSSVRTKPHNSALAPLRVPIHGQSVPNKQTGKAWVRASPRPQPRPPCSHADKWTRARGKGAFLCSGSKALSPRPQRGSRWRTDVDISEDHKISVGLAFPG